MLLSLYGIGSNTELKRMSLLIQNSQNLRRVKTDKRDSLKMATQRAANRLTGIHIPDEQQELSRLLNRTSGSLVKERTRIGNKIKSKL